MFILKEAIATASIQCSSEHKKDPLMGQFYGYGFLEYGSKEIPFSYKTKTGEIDLTGNPWQEKDLHSRWEGDNYAKWSDALKDIKSYIALVKNPKFVKIPREAILWVDPSFTPKSAPDSRWRYAY